MATYYRQPQNGYVERFGAGTMWAVLFFGPLYYVLKGEIGMGIGYFGLALILGVPTLGIGALLVHLVFIFAAPGIFGRSRLRRGWEKIPPQAYAGANIGNAAVPPPAN